MILPWLFRFPRNSRGRDRRIISARGLYKHWIILRVCDFRLKLGKGKNKFPINYTSQKINEHFFAECKDVMYNSRVLKNVFNDFWSEHNNINWNPRWNNSFRNVSLQFYQAYYLSKIYLLSVKWTPTKFRTSTWIFFTETMKWSFKVTEMNL